MATSGQDNSWKRTGQVGRVVPTILKNLIGES